MKVCIEALGCHSLPLESGKHKEQCELTSHHGSVLSTLQRTICDNASPGPCSLGSGSEHGLQRSLVSQGLCWGRAVRQGEAEGSVLTSWFCTTQLQSYRWALQAGTHLWRVKHAESLRGLIQSQSGEWLVSVYVEKYSSQPEQMTSLWERAHINLGAQVNCL